MYLEKPPACFGKNQEKFASPNIMVDSWLSMDVDVEGFYEGELQAYTVAIKKHLDGSFLLRPCSVMSKAGRRKRGGISLQG